MTIMKSSRITEAAPFFFFLFTVHSSALLICTEKIIDTLIHERSSPLALPSTRTNSRASSIRVQNCLDRRRTHDEFLNKCVDLKAFSVKMSCFFFNVDETLRDSFLEISTVS